MIQTAKKVGIGVVWVLLAVWVGSMAVEVLGLVWFWFCTGRPGN